MTTPLSRLVDEGKIGGMGLSELAPPTLHRAQAAYPVMAVQSEFSLRTRLPQLGLLGDLRLPRLGAEDLAASRRSPPLLEAPAGF